MDCTDGPGLAACVNAAFRAQAEQLSAQVAQLKSQAQDINTFWLLFGGCLVFFQQIGFAFLEVGCVQARNVKNILIKNCFDASLGIIAWYLVVYGIAFGRDSDGFIGRNDFALAGSSFRGKSFNSEYLGNDWALWFFQ